MLLYFIILLHAPVLIHIIPICRVIFSKDFKPHREARICSCKTSDFTHLTTEPNSSLGVMIS